MQLLILKSISLAIASYKRVGRFQPRLKSYMVHEECIFVYENVITHNKQL